MARKSLADLVPDDLPEDVEIPSHETPKRTRRRKQQTQSRRAQPAPAAAGETATDDAEGHEDAPQEQATPERPRRQRRASTARTAAPADEGVSHPRRVTLPLTNEDYKALNLAKIEDDVNVVTRLRAMVDLWQTNSRIREQIDRHARRMAR